MRKNLVTSFFCGLLLGWFPIFSQDSTSFRVISTSLESNIGFASQSTPFWFRVNQYATVPNKLPILSVRAARQATQSFKKNANWRWAYGAEAVVNAGAESNMVLPEIYTALRYKVWELYVGRRKETFGLCDSTLGTGSYAWSGNALPMPKLVLQIPQYTPVPYTKGWLVFKGHYAHSWFGENQYVSHHFLHQKTLHLRLGKAKSRFKWHGGFTHQVQWGGIANYDASSVANGNKFPSNLRAYGYVVTGLGGVVGQVKGFNAFDSTNRVGNHLGTIDMGVEIDLKRSRLFIYRQNIFEDGSLYYLNSISDGLHGISFTNLFAKREKGKLSIQKVLFEFLNTRSQGGREFNTKPGGKLGNDNYFNHQQFRDGWTYQGRIIGTPFITNRFDTKKKFQENGLYNGFESANNNRVRVYHVGVQGYFGEDVEFLSKISYSQNYGTYGHPYLSEPRQYSGLVQVMGKLPYLGGLQWTAAAAWDYGGLYEDSFGLQIGVRKNWRK
ncbi:MAG: capsule assembly Wzi family protein [Cytophagia bacterium]|nr:MAG: capsule assembly Wzi family protein [Runella sp.]TAG19645.1 MAG: capsule assembly Wzi family protein [Cytophagales bacterium]TAG40194.1 MAG: capsule assembly Wzi family protein [Cytophagia bacterium]TAG53446.1 MAG: capsule assembly Wzi family protein [Runella slithyformis]TAG80439.1 MAG: capsule assembly Wzi family protein [Cytophagales bacterium]